MRAAPTTNFTEDPTLWKVREQIILSYSQALEFAQITSMGESGEPVLVERRKNDTWVPAYLVDHTGQVVD
ncbi:MAG: hypothetical protein RI897_471 [Verrucomicrobiota bacterium]|jgi:hypothetical protein